MATHQYPKCPLPLKKDSKNIRVLDILPASDTARHHEIPIPCKLRSVDLDDNIPFEALSYVWGPSRDQRPILVNETPFYVNENLWQFLSRECSDRSRRVRRSRSHEPQYLWIDAICINQRSTAERSHQVGMMGSIFSKATRVIVWLGATLGDRDESRKSGFQALRQANQDFRKAKSSQGCNLKKAERLLRGELEYLFSNRYWTRMWIVQEYLLAHKIELRTNSDRLEGRKLAEMCTRVDLAAKHARVVRNVVRYREYPSHTVRVKDPATIVGPDSVRRMVRPPTVGDRTTIEIVDHRNVVRYFEATVGKPAGKNRPLELQMCGRALELGHRKPVVDEQSYEVHTQKNSVPILRTLKDMLFTFGDQQCQNPLDHVYALLSLVTKEDLERYELNPDYYKTPGILFSELVCKHHRWEDHSDADKIARTMAKNLEVEDMIDVDAALELARIEEPLDEALISLRATAKGSRVSAPKRRLQQVPNAESNGVKVVSQAKRVRRSPRFFKSPEAPGFEQPSARKRAKR